MAIARAGLPTPELQLEVHTPSGRFLGRTDFGWRGLRTVGEFDGLVKYQRLLKRGQHPSEVVVAEKLREDAIRAEDLSVVRWVWSDLDCFAPVATRLQRAFRAA